MNTPIGIFDSGLGGLTVARAIHEKLPQESLVYYGDTARVPYGAKSKETIVRFTRNAIDFLCAHEVKAIVIACNTASALALPLLSQEYDVPLIGVIQPGADAAVRATRNGHIGVIATSATIASNAYTHAIHEKKSDAIIYSHPCPLFVPLVEEGWIDHPATRIIIEDYLRTLRTARIDTLVLGCTHYPLLSTAISRYMGDAVTLVDSARTCADELSHYLTSHNLLAESGEADEHVFVTDVTPRFEEIATRFFGRTVSVIKVVSNE